MKDVLDYILKNITTQPADVEVKEALEDGTTNLTITVHPDDVGRVIGKEGKIIKAIRSIMRVAAIQKGLRVRVSVVSDDNTSQTATPQDNPTTEEVVVEEAPKAETETAKEPKAETAPPQEPEVQQEVTQENPEPAPAQEDLNLEL